MKKFQKWITNNYGHLNLCINLTIIFLLLCLDSSFKIPICFFGLIEQLIIVIITLFHPHHQKKIVFLTEACVTLLTLVYILFFLYFDYQSYRKISLAIMSIIYCFGAIIIRKYTDQKQ